MALWSIMTLALVIGWWRGGDIITEAVGRRIPRFSLPMLVALVCAVMVAMLVLSNAMKPAAAVLAVYLALSPAAILLYVANRLVPEGRTKLLLALGWLMIFFALFATLGRAAPREKETPPAVTAPVLAASGIGDTGPGITPATPRSPVDGWINVDDYAASAFARPGFYTQTLGLEIDAAGYVSGCRTIRASANAAIDVASCTGVTRRARLNPARGRDGEPVASTFTMVIVWNVPAGVTASPTAVPPLRRIVPPAPGLAVSLKPLSPVTDWVRFADYPADAMADNRDYVISFELDVDANGRATACRITAGSGSAVVDRTTCDAARRRARFTPARGARGEPVASRYGARLSWSVVPAPRPVPAMPASKPLAADRTAPDATLAAPPVLPNGDSDPKPD
jgi:TonB family protein